jgi:hypothetical protein
MRRFGNRLNVFMKDTAEEIGKEALLKGGWLREITKKTQSVIIKKGAAGNQTIISAIAGGQAPPTTAVTFSAATDATSKAAWMAKLDGLAEKYPGPNSLIAQIGDSPLRNPRASAETGYKGAKRTINFNTKWSNEELKTELYISAGKGRTVVSTVDDIATHEYGHVIDNYLRNKGLDTHMSMMGHPSVRVSDYAMKNQAEHFAESFVMYEKGNRTIAETQRIEALLKEAGLLG